MSDRMYINGKVFTGRCEEVFVTSFAVSGGSFSWTGGELDPTGRPVNQPVPGRRVEVIDLQGATVLPGLIDAHQHPTFVASFASGTCLLPPSVSDIDGIVSALRGDPARLADDQQPPDAQGMPWVLGWGYDESGLAERRQLTRYDLDRVSQRQPVFVRRSDAHSGSCNSVALRLAGITEHTPDPPGASFGRDKHGQPNGILTEIAAVEAVLAAAPPASPEVLVDALVRAGQHYSEMGLVAVGDMVSTIVENPLGLVRKAQDRGLAQRVNLYLGWDAICGNPPQLAESDRTGRVRIAGVKIFLDGTMSNRTAWVSRPFRGSRNEFGSRMASDDELRAALGYARANRIQLAVHAMGDAALSAVIDVLGDEEPWLGDIASVRVEHATLLTEDLTRRFAQARMDFAVVSHSIFYFAEYAAYAANLTTRQLLDAYPLARLYAGVAMAALSSDAPCTAWFDSDNVFRSVQAAVERRSSTGETLGFDQAITVPQALLLYTSRAARCAPFGGLGEIAAGRPADFVVLDSDVFTVPPGDLAKVRVAQTYIAGECVYDRRASSGQPGQ